MVPSWNWKGENLLGMWGKPAIWAVATPLIHWLASHYEPIEDEL